MVIGATGDQPRTKKPITFQERLGDDHLNETGHPHGRSIFLVICVGMAVLERRAERQKCNGPVEELFTDCAHQRDLISVLP
jgi:hypothetical protein